jgi:hypothetical protein
LVSINAAGVDTLQDAKARGGRLRAARNAGCRQKVLAMCTQGLHNLHRGALHKLCATSRNEVFPLKNRNTKVGGNQLVSDCARLSASGRRLPRRWGVMLAA